MVGKADVGLEGVGEGYGRMYVGKKRSRYIRV